MMRICPISIRTGNLVAILVLGCSCSGGSLAGPNAAPAQQLVTVEFYGARGNDEVDDTNAFRAALSALPATGGVLKIPAGTYYLRPTVGIDNIDSALALMGRSNITLAGAGMDQTILRMIAAPYSGDTHILLLDRAQHITLRDLTLDGNVPAASYSDEQSHGVEVRSGSNIRFESVRFMRTHGDGIRLLGMAKGNYSWVEQISIVDCRFENNGRSGVGVQRGVRGVTITGSTFTKVADQAVSMEPSSRVPNSAPRDFVVSENRFYATAPIAIAIVGVSDRDPARNIQVIHNTLEQAAILVVSGNDIRIEENVINGSNRSPIRIQRASQDIWIVRNQINDEGGLHAESASVVFAYDSPTAPTDVHFVGNTVRSGEYIGLYARDSARLEIRQNTFEGTGPSAIFVEDVISGSPLADFDIGQNQMTGYRVGVHFHSRGDVLSRVCLVNNSLNGVRARVRLTGPILAAC